MFYNVKIACYQWCESRTFRRREGLKEWGVVVPEGGEERGEEMEWTQ